MYDHEIAIYVICLTSINGTCARFTNFVACIMRHLRIARSVLYTVLKRVGYSVMNIWIHFFNMTVHGIVLRYICWQLPHVGYVECIC